MLTSLKTQLAGRVKTWLTADLQAKATDALLLQGRQASWRVRSLDQISSLQDVEFKVFSQWGEDGIIDWLVERADLPPHLRSFVEFGVEDYQEANTRFLLQNRNWRGLVMDGSPRLARELRRRNLHWRYDLTARSAFIARENINQLMTEAGFAGDIGLLSIDIDGVDYWVWEAIRTVSPVLCVCEYNAVLGDVWPVSVPYDPQFARTAKHFSYLYFGASIEALRRLGARKGYVFLGTNTAGNNAFFVRHDYASRFENALARRVSSVSMFRESRDAAGELTCASGLARLDAIGHLPVVNVETGDTMPLRELTPLYSQEWLACICRA